MLHLILLLVYWLLTLLVLGHVVLSFMPQARYHPLGEFIYRFSEPLLAPIRRILPPISIGNGVHLDLSPLIFLVALSLLAGFFGIGCGCGCGCGFFGCGCR